MKRKQTVYAVDIASFTISLNKLGRDKFQVVYGKQITDNLNYVRAAKELGECIMHALTCEGKLDNH